MSKVPDEEMIEIVGPEEIPHFASEEEEDQFWATHCIGATYASRVGRTPKEDLPLPTPREQRDADLQRGQ